MFYSYIFVCVCVGGGVTDLFQVRKHIESKSLILWRWSEWASNLGQTMTYYPYSVKFKRRRTMGWYILPVVCMRFSLGIILFILPTTSSYLRQMLKLSQIMRGG